MEWKIIENKCMKTFKPMLPELSTENLMNDKRYSLSYLSIQCNIHDLRGYCDHHSRYMIKTAELQTYKQELSLNSLLWRPTQLYLRGGVSQKWGTVIPVYSWHTFSKRAHNIIPVYNWHTLSKRAQHTKTAKART